jgi:hypothetical protein
MLDELVHAQLHEQQNNEDSLKKDIEDAALFESILTSEGWIRFERELNNLEQSFVHEPEIYAERDTLVHFDCGGRAALRAINEFILKQKNTIKKYVEESNKS